MLSPAKMKKSPKPNKFIRFTSAGFQIGLTIWLGNLLGKWLDQKYDNDLFEPIITFVAILASMYVVIIQVIRISKEND